MVGHFISLEGGEGSGKSSQVALLRDAFSAASIPAIITREPGGGPRGGQKGGKGGAESIRDLLVTGTDEKWHVITETLLFQAARVEHVERPIKPALSEGKTVISDRFMDSTLVYQGIGRGLGMNYIEQLHLLTLGDFKPDLTLFIDIPPDLGLERAAKRKGNETRFESLSLDFHERVRQGFQALAAASPERIVTINGALPSPQLVYAEICIVLKNRLGIAL